MVRQKSKKSHSRGHIEKQHGKHTQARFKFTSQRLYHIHRSLSSQLSWKNSLLLRWQFLGLLDNTLGTDEKYNVLNRENLTMPIQMQLSQKQKTISDFFAKFLKSRLNFKHFESKGYPYRFSIFEVTESENVVTKISKKFRFRRCFDKQNGKRAQALFKLASNYVYQIQWSLPSQLSRKKSLLLTWKILVLPVHSYDYGLRNRSQINVYKVPFQRMLREAIW